MALPRMKHAHERLDDRALEARTLAASLADVAAVNRWLGGTRAVLRPLAPLLRAGRELRILDAGCGVADIPLAIVRRATRSRTRVCVHAVDAHPVTAGIAARHTAAQPGIVVTCADVRALPFRDNCFDAALLSLTLHHLDEGDQVPALRELLRVSRGLIVVNELHRTWLNYGGARLLAATLWRRRPITRHDGPLSVRRAFTPRELRELARRAGLPQPVVRRRFFYRVVLVADARAAS